MKKLYFYLLWGGAMAVSLATTACKDDTPAEPDTLSAVCSEQTAMPYQASAVRIIVETNTEWSAAKAEADDWYTLSATSGTGNAEIEVKAEANTGNDTRTGTVTITAGSLQQSVEFSQLGRSSEPPAAAGAIEGKEEAATGETVELSVAEIEGATDYKWYKDGVELQTGPERTLSIVEGGVYKVAGVNISGEGAASPEKTVKFDSSKFRFTKAVGIYEGGDYNKEFHVTLSASTGENSEIGALLVFCEKEPEGIDDPALSTITLPARDYLATQPLYNNYSAIGVVISCNGYALDKSHFYAIKDGAIVEDSYRYLCTTGGFEANKDNWQYDFAKVSVSYDPATRNYTISGTVPCFTLGEYRKEIPAGEYEFSYEGPITFKNNWRVYNKFYFTDDNLEEDFNLTGTLTASSLLYYFGKVDGEGHKWKLELYQDKDQTKFSWDICMEFYTPAENGMNPPYGTYTVAETPKAGAPMTVDRGYYWKPSYGGLRCQWWDPQLYPAPNYSTHVLGQPDSRSYVKLSDNGSGGYSVDVVMFDSKGHKITAQYSGAIQIQNNSGN